MDAVLGVDVGGVIVDRVAEGDDTSFFGNQPMLTPAVPGVFEALALLATEVFVRRVHLVSKAGPRVESRTRAWLIHHHFEERTGIGPDQLHFVRARVDKAPVCVELGVTHFVDDNLEVLGYLDTVAHRYLFIGGLGANQPPRSVPGWATVVDTWPRLVEFLRTSVYR